MAAGQERFKESTVPGPRTETVEHIDQSAEETVLISSLELGCSPRLNGENMDHVRLLVESSSDLPPILVHRGSMRVIDGMHRLRAVMQTGRETIRVRFFEGTERDAFVLAVRANIAHGLPLSLQDRRAAAERIITSHPEWSDRAISLTVGLAARTVAEIRTVTAQPLQTEARIGLDGRSRPVNSAERRRLAGELMLKNPMAPLREIAREADISPATASNVRDRIRCGEDPVPARLRTAPKIAGQRRETDRGPSAEVAQDIDRALSGKLTETIDSLRRDPLLRFSEAGRQLLRTLDSCMMIGLSRQKFVENIPPLRASSIVELVFGCAMILQAFADELREKHMIPQTRTNG